MTCFSVTDEFLQKNVNLTADAGSVRHVADAGSIGGFSRRWSSTRDPNQVVLGQ
jgi:hypothetical protein